MQAVVNEEGQLVRGFSKVNHLRDVVRHRDRIRVFGELVLKHRPLEQDNFVREALQSMAPEVLKLLEIKQPKEFVQWDGFQKVRNSHLTLMSECFMA